MRFKSARPCSRTSKASQFSQASIALIVLFAFVSGWRAAFATIVLSPGNGGVMVNGVVSSPLPSGTVPPQGETVGGGGIIYYPVITPSGSPTAPIDTTDTTLLKGSLISSYFNLFDATVGQDDDPSPTRANMIRINFTSDKVSGGAGYYVVVKAIGTVNTTVEPVPIAAVGGVPCGNAQCTWPNATPTPAQSSGISDGHLFAAPYTGGTIELGFYPKDICTDFKGLSSGTESLGCAVQGTVDTVNAIPGQAVPLMQLTFSVVQGSFDASSNFIVGSTADSANAMNLGFQADSPALGCPTLTNVYTPGDTTINLSTGAFTASGTAPPQTVIVLGNNGADPDVGSDFGAAGTNDIVARATIGGTASIGTFTNAPDASSDLYDISFAVRNSAGQVALPSGPAACGASCAASTATISAAGLCGIDGVQTEAILGFLSKSSCFIATGAFRSMYSPPLVMLRAFRDRVLEQSSLGRAFVHWYYHWSPDPAVWLVFHPDYRFPVLTALIPVELLALACLHPFAALLILGMLALATARAIGRARAEGSA